MHGSPPPKMLSLPKMYSTSIHSYISLSVSNLNYGFIELSLAYHVLINIISRPEDGSGCL